MKLEIEGLEPGDKVISIEVARKALFDRKCKHYEVEIDPSLAFIECRQCKEKLNPVEWLAFMTEEWERITRLYKLYVEAKALYDEKQRTQCEHCKKITRVNPPSDFTNRMRKRGHLVY